MVGLLYSTDDEVTSVYEQNRSVTQNSPSVSVSVIIQAVENKNSGDALSNNPTPSPQTPGGSQQPEPFIPPTPGDPTTVPQIDKSSWLNCAVTCHMNWYASGLRYGYAQYDTFTDPYTNTSYSIRKDCSGYVSFCLYQYTGQGNTHQIASSTMRNYYQLYGLQKLPGNTELKQGDILVYNNHVEIYWEDTARSYNVLNWGSTGTLNRVYASGKYDIIPCSGTSKTKNGIKEVYRF